MPHSAHQNIRSSIKVAMEQCLLYVFTIIHHNNQKLAQMKSDDGWFIKLTNPVNRAVQVFSIQQKHENVTSEPWQPWRTFSNLYQAYLIQIWKVNMCILGVVEDYPVGSLVVSRIKMRKYCKRRLRSTRSTRSAQSFLQFSLFNTINCDNLYHSIRRKIHNKLVAYRGLRNFYIPQSTIVC